MVYVHFLYSKGKTQYGSSQDKSKHQTLKGNCSPHLQLCLQEFFASDDVGHLCLIQSVNNGWTSQSGIQCDNYKEENMGYT